MPWYYRTVKRRFEWMARKKGKSPRVEKLIKNIALNVVQLRNSNRWTQEQAAEKLECDLRWYQRLESGKYVFSLETLTRLAEMYKVQERELLDYINWRNDNKRKTVP